MQIVYFSLTGNSKRFAQQIDKNAIPMKEYQGGDFALICPTVGFGVVPRNVVKFLNQHHNQCKFIIGSGNRNWGPNFAKAADIIGAKLNIPTYKIELAGSEDDVAKVKNLLHVYR